MCIIRFIAERKIRLKRVKSHFVSRVHKNIDFHKHPQSSYPSIRFDKNIFPVSIYMLLHFVPNLTSHFLTSFSSFTFFSSNLTSRAFLKVKNYFVSRMQVCLTVYVGMCMCVYFCHKNITTYPCVGVACNLNVEHITLWSPWGAPRCDGCCTYRMIQHEKWTVRPREILLNRREDARNIPPFVNPTLSCPRGHWQNSRFPILLEYSYPYSLQCHWKGERCNKDRR